MTDFIQPFRPLNCDESQKLIELARPRVTQATVDRGPRRVTDERTRVGSSYQFVDDNFYTTKIREAVASIANAPLAAVEPVWVLYYPIGGFFRAHTDDRHVARSHTALVYLNNDFSGGATFFRDNQVAMYPSTHASGIGAGLIFGSHMMHQSTEVVKGYKWAAVTWVIKQDKFER